jgi:DNA-binding transcriptional regulator YbjK
MQFQRRHGEPRSGKDRRYDILDAALRIIAEGGPDAVTFRKVAAVAKAPLSLLTYYFASREELIREAFRLHLAEVARLLSDLEPSSGPPKPDDVIELAMGVVRREFEEDPAMVALEYELILYARRDPKLAREFNAYESGMEAQLGKFLESLGARHPFDGARTILDLVRGFEIEGLTNTRLQTELLERRLRLVLDALLNESHASTSTTRGERPGRRLNRRERPKKGKSK